jgi:hypothetical protein
MPSSVEVSWRTAKALVSEPGAIARTVMPFEASAAWSASAFACPSLEIFVAS